MTNIKPLSESQEDYLEAIFALMQQKGAARVKDVAQSMNVASASVNKAVASLTLGGYIEHERYELIKLTQKGERKAREVSVNSFF
jgi:DtxR family Mn-dependent transcriptional regulator